MSLANIVWRWRVELSDQSRGYDVAVFGLCWLVYAALAYLALGLLSSSDGVPALWPASGFAAGLAVALGSRAWLPVALGVAAATFTANYSARSSVPVILVFAAANALECVLFAFLFHSLDRGRAMLESFSSVLAFFAAAILSTAVAAVPAALALTLLGRASDSVETVWLTWMESDLIGILCLAPVLITVRSFVQSRPTRRQIAEGIGASACTVLAAMITFVSTPVAHPFPQLPPAAFMLPLLLWLAARTHPFFASITLLGAAFAIGVGALVGSFRFGGPDIPLSQRMFAAESNIVTAALATLALASLFARLNRAVDALKSSEQRLKLALADERIFAFDFEPGRDRIHRSGGLLKRLHLPPVGVSGEFYPLIHADDLSRFLSERSRLSPEIPAVTIEYRVITPAGDTIIIQQNTEGVFDARGNLVRLVGTCLDITEREEARKAIETRERQLKEALAAGRVYTFEYDAATGHYTRSDNAASILDIQPFEIESGASVLLRRLSREDRRIVREAVARMTPASPHMTGVVRVPASDGQVIWVELAGTGHFDGAGTMTGITGIVRDITRTKRAEERRDQVIDELDHRVKNALDRMLGVIRLSRVGETDVDAFAKSLERRILSMAKTHERLSSKDWDGVDIGTLVDDELAAFRTPANCVVEGAAVELPPKAAQALSFTLHELATNASKYGALSTPGGRVHVSWSLDEPAAGALALRLRWMESCDFEVRPPSRSSYGLLIIRGLLPMEVRGSRVETDFTPTGLRCTISLALASRPATASRQPLRSRVDRDAAE